MNQKRKMRYTSQKGITLIALVITIIVLLILAGVTINMVLGDDGIIAQAQDAKKAQQESEDTQAIKLATGEAATSEHLGVLTESEVEAQSDIEFTEDNPYNNSIREILKFDDKYLPIPKGMAYAYGTIDEGAVVVDKYGNEFVWIPVDNVVDSGEPDYEDDEVLLINNANDKRNSPSKNGIPTDVGTDYEKMKTSVEIYGGFYVGRYETSWTGTRVASVPNVTAMKAATDLGLGWTDIYTSTLDKNEATWYGLYEKQKELHKNSTSMESRMIWGSQWDAIMDWMSDESNPYAIDPENNLYINDSNGMGNYLTSEPIETGSNSAYAVKNIFDLAGNYAEWTQDRGDTTNTRVYRGGSWATSVSLVRSASSRYGTMPENGYNNISSRLQLYIN